jgi:hypothetical protein
MHRHAGDLTGLIAVGEQRHGAAHLHRHIAQLKAIVRLVAAGGRAPVEFGGQFRFRGQQLAREGGHLVQTDFDGLRNTDVEAVADRFEHLKAVIVHFAPLITLFEKRPAGENAVQLFNIHRIAAFRGDIHGFLPSKKMP